MPLAARADADVRRRMPGRGADRGDPAVRGADRRPGLGRALPGVRTPPHRPRPRRPGGHLGRPRPAGRGADGGGAGLRGRGERGASAAGGPGRLPAGLPRPGRRPRPARTARPLRARARAGAGRARGRDRLGRGGARAPAHVRAPAAAGSRRAGAAGHRPRLAELLLACDPAAEDPPQHPGDPAASDRVGARRGPGAAARPGGAVAGAAADPRRPRACRPGGTPARRRCEC